MFNRGGADEDQLHKVGCLFFLWGGGGVSDVFDPGLVCVELGWGCSKLPSCVVGMPCQILAVDDGPVRTGM